VAITLQTAGGRLVKPGAYSQTKVQSDTNSFATTGVIMVVGEADAGPRFSVEGENLKFNSFGPDQLGEIQAKYQSGALPDACREAIAALLDGTVVGSFSRIIPCKTNASTAGSGTITNWGSTTYGTIAAVTPGSRSNLITKQVKTSVAEILPTTGAFTFLPPIASTNISTRANGQAAQAYTIPALQLPSAFVSGVDALSGVAATGGANRGVLGGVAGTLAVAIVTGNSVTITIAGATYAVAATAGDTVYIPAGSAIAGAASANCGSYVVTAATTAVITATKLLDASGTPNQLTAPVAVSATNVVATTDVRAFAPVTITLESGTPIDGVGKSLEIAELTSGTGLLSYLAYALSTTPVTWVSSAATPALLSSGAEYVPNLQITRAFDNLSEDIVAGGPVAMKLSYTGTTATATIASGVLTTAVVGGSGSAPAPITLSNFVTISDLCALFNSLTGWKAAPGTAGLGQQSPTTLDAGVYNVGSTQGAYNGRIKQDAFRFADRISQSTTVHLSGTTPTAGVPKPDAALSFLSGGARGGTSNADVVAALLALQTVKGNFVVTLFSNDAAQDIADGLTDPTSSYTIESVNAALVSHCVTMSTLKRRRERQGFGSFRGSFTAAKEAAGNMASFVTSCAFQDVRAANSAGTVVQQRPWMLAVKAAGGQAAAGSKDLTGKQINVSGVLQAAGDFDPGNDSQVEDALLAGLLVATPGEAGGFEWVSDQTTWIKDDNFVYNSIQAVYAINTIAATCRLRTEQAFKGKTPAEFSAASVKTCVEKALDDLRGDGWIAASDDAPSGYGKIAVRVEGPVIKVKAQVVIATGNKFILIDFTAVPATQSA
jgi:hypothetical protein